MARTKGKTTKSVYVEVSDELWAKLKVTCINKKQTLRKFLTELLEKTIK